MFNTDYWPDCKNSSWNQEDFTDQIWIFPSTLNQEISQISVCVYIYIYIVCVYNIYIYSYMYVYIYIYIQHTHTKWRCLSPMMWGCTLHKDAQILSISSEKKCPSPRFPSGPLNLLMSKWMSNIGCRRGRGVKSERPVQKPRRALRWGLWGFTISSWNVTTVDGCEILHHQKDGWNMLKPYK